MHYFMEIMHNYPPNTFFQQDGLPAHYQRAFHAYFNYIIPQKSVYRGVKIYVPKQSPDITQLDFFVRPC